MFGRPKIIIAIAKEKIIAAKVNIGKKKIIDSIELGWSLETLDMAFSKAIEKFKSKSIRVLFSEDLSYVLRLTVPSDIKFGAERKYISEKITEVFPENLKDSDWDFKEVRITRSKEGGGEKRDVLVFAPVKDVFRVISETVGKLKMKVEAIEPEVVAATRDPNPIVGLALKEDVVGRDEEVLNLEPVGIADETSDEEITEENNLVQEAEKLKKEETEKEEGAGQGESPLSKEEKPKKVTPLTILLVIILLAFLAFAVYFFKFRGQKESDQVDQGIGVTLTSTPTPTLEEESEEVDISAYKLQVLNGSGVAGEAGYVANLLKSAGFAEADTGNATSSAFTKTEVSLKESVEAETFALIRDSLDETYDVASESGILTSGDYDIVVTVGKRL